MIEKENETSADYALKSVPTARLAAMTDNLDPAEMEQRIGPMFDRVQSELGGGHTNLATPIVTYVEIDAGMAVVVGFGHDGALPSTLEVADLPAASTVCEVHLGPMSDIHESWHALHK